MTFDRAHAGKEIITNTEASQRVPVCKCCETVIPQNVYMRGGNYSTVCDWCERHCRDNYSQCTRKNNQSISRIYTVPGMVYRLWEWENHDPLSKDPLATKKVAKPTEPSFPQSIRNPHDGELENLWLGDCSGWEVSPKPEGFLEFRHRCGFEIMIPGFYLANVLAQWFDRGKHNCSEQS